MSTKRPKMQDNRGNEDDERKPAAKGFVWVEVPIDPNDDKEKTMTSIVVEEGDFIDTIKEAIKIKCSPEFDSVSTTRIELFKSEQDVKDKKPLDPRTKWNSTVTTWGTDKKPLFVKALVKRISESPQSGSKGKYC